MPFYNFWMPLSTVTPWESTIGTWSRRMFLSPIMDIRWSLLILVWQLVTKSRLISVVALLSICHQNVRDLQAGRTPITLPHQMTFGVSAWSWSISPVEEIHGKRLPLMTRHSELSWRIPPFWAQSSLCPRNSTWSSAASLNVTLSEEYLWLNSGTWSWPVHDLRWALITSFHPHQHTTTNTLIPRTVQAWLCHLHLQHHLHHNPSLAAGLYCLQALSNRLEVRLHLLTLAMTQRTVHVRHTDLNLLIFMAIWYHLPITKSIITITSPAWLFTKFCEYCSYGPKVLQYIIPGYVTKADLEIQLYLLCMLDDWNEVYASVGKFCCYRVRTKWLWGRRCCKYSNKSLIEPSAGEVILLDWRFV